MEYDESFKFYENSELIQTGAYKLRYFDNYSEYLILFYENKPLVFSIKIGSPHMEQGDVKNDIMLDDIINKLDYRSTRYGIFTEGIIYYIKHIWRKDIAFIICDSWLDSEDYNEIKIFRGNHPLNYRFPDFPQ
jgi:hypothetical protein